jgi:hypothetical protein
VSYVEVLLGQEADLAWPFGALAGLGVISVVFKLRNIAPTKTVPAADLDIIVGISCLIPAIIFVFAVVATHAFSPRYAIAAAIGFSILIARWAAVMPRPQLACCMLIGVLMVGEARPAVSASEPREQALQVLSHAPEGLSIATDDGLRYFELREGSVADVARRLVYVMRPVTSGKPDLTNEHQVLRWAKIDPTVKVETAAAVLARQPKILIFSQGVGADLLPKLAADNGFQLTVENRVGSATLYLASRRSGALRLHS